MPSGAIPHVCTLYTTHYNTPLSNVQQMTASFKISRHTYVDELDAVLLDGVQGDGDVLQGVRLAGGSLVVSQLPLLQRLH